MRVLNWVQSRIHGSHCSKKKSESSAGSARLADTSSGLPRNDELHEGWPAAILSIGTFGIGEGHRLKNCSDGSYIAGVDELKKMQEELTLLMRAKGVTTTEDGDQRCHLPLKRSLNGGIVKQRSFRKLVTSAFSGFLPRPSFRETMPELRVTEILRALLDRDTHPQNLALSEAVMKNDRTVQMPWKGDAMGEGKRSKWIRTDSEYIVLEI